MTQATDFFDPTTAEESQQATQQAPPQAQPVREKGLWAGSFTPLIIPDAPPGKNKALVYENTKAGTCILLLPNLNPNQTHDFEAFLTRKDYMEVVKDPSKGIRNGTMWKYTHKKDGTKLDSPFMSGWWDGHRANINFVPPEKRRDREVAYMHIKRPEPRVKSQVEADTPDTDLPF